MIRILLVEDSKIEADSCCAAIHRLREAAVIISVPNAEKAFYFLDQDRDGLYFDIFFLDVDLPGISGFQLAEIIRARKHYRFTPIVFVTGNAVDELNAFRDYHCYSYIVKPFSVESMRRSVGLLLEGTGVPERKEGNGEKWIVLSAKEGNICICTEDILYAEVFRKTCCVHVMKEAVQKEYHLLQTPLEKFSRNVDDAMFVQCHKSFWVNVKMIDSLKKLKRDLWEVFFMGTNGDGGCEVSATFYDQIMRLHSQYVLSL